MGRQRSGVSAQVQQLLIALLAGTRDGRLGWKKTAPAGGVERYSAAVQDTAWEILVLYPEVDPPPAHGPVIFRLEQPVAWDFSPGTQGHDLIFQTLAVGFKDWAKRYKTVNSELSKLLSRLGA